MAKLEASQSPLLMGLSDGVFQNYLDCSDRSIFVELFNDSQSIEVDECTS